MNHRKEVTFEVHRGGHPPGRLYFEKLSVADRLGMMWQLAMEAWELKGEPVAEQRLPRHAVLFKRKGC